MSENNPLPGPDVTLLEGGRGNIRGDAKLIERAIANRWPMPAEARVKAVERLQDLVANSTDPRIVASATKTLATIDKLNLEYTKFEVEQQRLDNGEATSRTDLTSGGKPLAAGLTVTSADLSAVAGLLGLGKGGSNLSQNG